MYNETKYNGVEVKTARLVSRELDNMKVDLANTPMFNFQCKNTISVSTALNALKDMPDDNPINVVLLKRTKKANSKFVTQGKYAMLDMDDFLKILKRALK